MSVALKLSDNGNSKRAYLIYDFKQVSDSILLIMYVDELKRWKKFFINYEDGEWKTDTLASYANSETLQRICDKLKFIFSEKEHVTKYADFDFDKILHEDATFMLGVFS
jgi:hypothetical protein